MRSYTLLTQRREHEASLNRCPLCGSASVHAFATTDRNQHTTSERFEYRRCSNCEALFLADPPMDLAPFYPSGQYKAASPEHELAIERPKLALVQQFVQSGRLIEVGTGPGYFTELALREGFDVIAIEMDADSCERLEALGARTIRSAEPERAITGAGPASVIALWHTLEHLRQPWETLASASAVLEPGGIMAISMPNPESLQARLLKGRWVHVEAPRHLFLIPLHTLTARLATFGLECMVVVTDDGAGRWLTQLGWQTAIRELISREWLSHRIARGLSQLSGGAAYSAVFVKRP
jgi:2-polyprenyl-3-methyl-5-hydroxy-6-metoxy-1,4-benzoquinol methylase